MIDSKWRWWIGLTRLHDDNQGEIEAHNKSSLKVQTRRIRMGPVLTSNKTNRINHDQLDQKESEINTKTKQSNKNYLSTKPGYILTWLILNQRVSTSRVSKGEPRFPWIPGSPSHTAQTCLSLFLIFGGFVMSDFIASTVLEPLVFFWHQLKNDSENVPLASHNGLHVFSQFLFFLLKTLSHKKPPQKECTVASHDDFHSFPPPRLCDWAVFV